MRALVIIAGALIALGAPAAAATTAMPTPPATSVKLEQLATIVEGMHGSSRIVDQRIADLLRPFAATEGVIIPTTASAYTQLPASSERLRPRGWLISFNELNNGWVCATLSKWDSGGLAVGRDKGGRSHVSGPTAGALAMTAAMLRAWAQDMREAGQ